MSKSTITRQMRLFRPSGRKAVLLLIIVAALWIAYQLATPSAEDSLSNPPAQGVVLTSWLNSDILSTDPGTKRDQNTDSVQLHIVEGLVALRNDASVAPLLAESWTVSEAGKLYTFKLRDNVHFHNGAPLTSDEVVWTINRYLAPETHWRCRGEFSDGRVARIESVTAVDRLTVTIRLDQSAPLFLTTLARTDCAGTGIIHPDSVSSDGSWIKPIGTGPFKLSEWQRNRYVELEKFDDYSALTSAPDGNTGRKEALVDRIRFMVIPDSSSARAALLRGKLDVLDGLSPQELISIEGRPGISFDSSPTWDVYALLLQSRDPLLNDPRLRRAIALSIDATALSDAVTWKTAVPNSSFIPSKTRYFDAIQPQLIQRNLAEARRLAEASGYSGEPISIATNHRYPQMFDTAVLAQAMAQEAGINLQIETLDWASQFSRYARGDYQIMSFAYSARPDPSMHFGTIIGDRTKDPRRVWTDPEAISLIGQSITTSDEAQRTRLFAQMNELFLKDTPSIALFNSTRITALRSNVSGYQSWAAGLPRLWNVSKGPDPVKAHPS